MDQCIAALLRRERQAQFHGLVLDVPELVVGLLALVVDGEVLLTDECEGPVAR